MESTLKTGKIEDWDTQRQREACQMLARCFFVPFIPLVTAGIEYSACPYDELLSKRTTADFYGLHFAYTDGNEYQLKSRAERGRRYLPIAAVTLDDGGVAVVALLDESKTYPFLLPQAGYGLVLAREDQIFHPNLNVEIMVNALIVRVNTSRLVIRLAKYPGVAIPMNPYFVVFIANGRVWDVWLLSTTKVEEEGEKMYEVSFNSPSIDKICKRFFTPFSSRTSSENRNVQPPYRYTGLMRGCHPDGHDEHFTRFTKSEAPPEDDEKSQEQMNKLINKRTIPKEFYFTASYGKPEHKTEYPPLVNLKASFVTETPKRQGKKDARPFLRGRQQTRSGYSRLSPNSRQNRSPSPRQNRSPSPRQNRSPSPRQSGSVQGRGNWVTFNPSPGQTRSPSPRQNRSPSPRQSGSVQGRGNWVTFN